MITEKYLQVITVNKPETPSEILTQNTTVVPFELSSDSSIIPVTYAELVSYGDNITPLDKYLLTDFKGKFQLYDETGLLLSQTYETPLEPLILSLIGFSQEYVYDEETNQGAYVKRPIFEGVSMLYGDYVKYSLTNRLAGYLASDKGEIYYREDKIQNIKSSVDWRHLKYINTDNQSNQSAIDVGLNSEIDIPNKPFSMSKDYYTLGLPIIIFVTSSYLRIVNTYSLKAILRLSVVNSEITIGAFSGGNQNVIQNVNFSHSNFQAVFEVDVINKDIKNINMEPNIVKGALTNISDFFTPFKPEWFRNFTTYITASDDVLIDPEQPWMGVTTKKYKRYIDISNNTQILEECL